jgi:hypothetical protein
MMLSGDTQRLVLQAREAGDDASTLRLRWSDGQISRLRLQADAAISCPTHKPQGDQPRLIVGDGRRSVLVFDYVDRPGHQVLEAELRLRVVKARGQGQLWVWGVEPVRRGEPMSGISDGLQQDRGLERQAGVWFHERFERRGLAGEWAGPRDTLVIVRNGFEPIDGHALRVRIPRGTHTGLQHNIRLGPLNDGREPEEAYFRYHLWLDDSWDPFIDGGKLPGFAGTYGQAGWGGRPTDGTNGWSARGAFMRAEPGSSGRAIGSYVYTAQPGENRGTVWGWNLGPTGWLGKKRWVAIEQHLKLNTPGQPDGILRAWINGELAFEKRDVQWRDSPDLRIETLWMNIFHGGTAVPDQDLVLYIDNLVIADRYIGPGRFAPLR